MNLPEFLTQDAYGEIRLTGHRIGLQHIIDRHGEGASPEAINEEFPTIPVAIIDAVLSFYQQNRAEIDTYVRRCRAAMESQEAMPRKGPDAAELRRRMEAKRPKESA
jgi:uncharacterized protein (DUF433 family)